MILDNSIEQLQNTFTTVEMDLITSSIGAAGLDALRVPIQVGASPSVIDSLRKSGSIISRWPLFGLTESLELHPAIVALVKPVVFPDVALRLSFVNSDVMAVVTYCILPESTVRVINTEAGTTLNPLPTQEVLVAVRGDLPLAPHEVVKPSGVKIDYSIVASAGELSMAGNQEAAILELIKAGVPDQIAASYVDALTAPVAFGVAFNGSTGVAWLQGPEGDSVWWGPAADSQASDSVYVGEISSLDVLIGIGGLLPSGPEWDGILYPVRSSEGIETNLEPS